MSKINKKKLEKKLHKQLKGNKFKNALKTANRLSRMFPDEAKYILLKAKCYEMLEKIDEAVKEYKSSLKVLGKDDIESYCFIHNELADRDRLEDALDVVEEGLKIDPNHKSLVLNKANLLVDLDRLEEFYEYVAGFSKTDEHWKDIQSIKSDLELSFGNDEKAIELCDEVLEQEFDMDIFAKKINILSSLGLMDEVEELLNKLINNEEYESRAIALKAYLYSENDKNDEALDLLDDYLLKNPKNYEINLAKGLVHLNLDELEKAEEYMRIAFKENQYDDEEEEEDNVDEKDDILSYYDIDSSEEELFKSITDVDISVAFMFFGFGHIERCLEILKSIPKESKAYPLAQEIFETILEDIKESLGLTDDINEDMGIVDTDDMGDLPHDPRMPFEKEEFQGTEAYDLITMAWENENPRKSKQLAKKAIKVDKYAIDAYNVLAYHTLNDDLRQEYFKTAIDLFNETHDEEYFDEYTGHFWKFVETRPFMRAMQGYADGLYFQGDEEEAAKFYEYMLEFNPGDNQGVRYTYINSLLILNRLDEVVDVFEEYEDEYSTYFLFSKLLWAIKSGHDEKSLKVRYLEAIESNEYVTPFLLGNKKMPSDLPGYYSPGDSSEAVEYLRESLIAWKKDDKALETLEYLDVTYRVKNK